MTTLGTIGGLAALQQEFDEDQARGYRGAVVDPNPNSAYSQESDPTTSPGSTETWGARRFVIDEYADPDNPHADVIYDRRGIVPNSAQETELRTDTDSAPIVARAAAVDGTKKVGEADFDGTVTSVKVTLDSALTGVATNTRTFTLHNKTKDVNVASLTTGSGTDFAAATPKTLTLSGTAANLKVSKGDVLELVETHAGTGIAHSAGSVEVKIDQQD